MRKQVTQAELRECLDLETSVNRRMMRIRERIMQGAKVEPGELGARAEPGSNDFSPECASYHNMGLEIDDRETIEEFKSWQREDEARQMRSKIAVIRGGNLEVEHA